MAMSPERDGPKKLGSAARRRGEPLAADEVATNAVSGTVSGEGLGETIQPIAIQILDRRQGRPRPPGAVDEFIERWIGREDVRRILEAWAK